MKPAECPIFAAGPQYCCGACHNAKLQELLDQRTILTMVNYPKEPDKVGIYRASSPTRSGFGHWYTQIDVSEDVSYAMHNLSEYVPKDQAKLPLFVPLQLVTVRRNCALEQ